MNPKDYSASYRFSYLVNALLRLSWWILLLTAINQAFAGGNQSGNSNSPYVWPDAALPIKWHLSKDGLPGSGISNKRLAEELSAAFNTWQNIPTSKIAFQYGGEVDRRKGGDDGLVLVTFTDPEEVFPPEVLAYARIFTFAEPTTITNGDLDGDGTLDFPVGTYPAGTIYNADIMFDSSKNLTVSGEDFTNDIRMIALHEIGHLIGLSHSSIEKASLWPFAHGNVAAGRSLAEDDIAYASLFYPQAPQYSQVYGTISGQITDGIYKHGVLGAHIFAADKTTGEKQVGGYSLSSGTYLLPVKQGSYYVGIEPLDGDPRGMDPYRINDVIANTRDTAFTTEYFDANESGIEADPLAAVPVNVTSNAATNAINLMTNAVNFPGVVRRFKPGANYFAYPVVPPAGLRAFELLKALGTADEFNSLDRFNPTLQKFERASFINGEPQGINFPIRRGEGYLVHAKQEHYVTFKGIADCPKVSLVTGLNLFAVPCPSNGYSSFELLEDLGSKDEVISLKHLNSGRADDFKETHYAGENPGGEQFYIANGEAYYAQMAVAKSAVTLPSNRRAFPPVITSISPGRGVPGDLVMIQGEGFDPSLDNNSILFNGLPAHIVYTTPTIIAATVPANATSGPIKVTANGRDSNIMAFTILPKTIEENILTESGETTTPILPNQTASGSLTQATEQDRYTFMGLEHDVATIKARSIAPANLGLILAVEDPNGVIIASTDAASFEAQLTNLVLPSTGRYSVVVFAAGEHDRGQYTVSLNVHNDTATVGQINITQGDGQTTLPGNELPEPIQIYVTGPTGKPLAGAPVTFTATDVNLSSASNGYSAANAGSTQIVTDANGVATVNVTAPNTTGVYTITVNVPGLAPRTLQLSITNKKVARIEVSEQTQDCGGLGCPVGELLPEPYSLRALDDDGNGIPNVFVQWLVVTGKGELKQFSPTANSSGRHKTDADGRVKVFHKLGEKLYSEKAGEPTGIPIAQSVVAVVSGEKANTILFQPKTKANKPSKLESTKADYIRATYGTSEFAAFRIRVRDRFNNPVENAEIHPGGLSAPMDIVPGIDTQPGQGQTQAEQFTSFKTNRLGIWAGQLVIGKSTPTFDEFNSTSAAGLAPTYKVTLGEATAGTHTFSIDVDLGPKMATPPGQPKVVEGLIGQAFEQPVRQLLFRFQRQDTFKDLGNGKDEDNGDWRDEKFDRLATFPVGAVPVEISSLRLDGQDFTAQGFKPLSLNNTEGAATVTSGDDGIITANVKGGDLLGDHFVTAKVNAPITLQLKTDTGTPIGEPVTYPLESYQSRDSIARVLAPELTATIKAAPGSSLDWQALNFSLNSSPIFSSNSGPQLLNTLPKQLKLFLDGAEQAVWPTPEILAAGDFSSLTLVYSPTAKDLQTGPNKLSQTGQLKDIQGNTAPVSKEQTFNWPPASLALADRQWEFNQAIGGLRVAYQLPDDETDFSDLLETQPNRDRRVRNLGGLRLKYSFKPPSLNSVGNLEPVQSIAWQFNADGWICSGPGMNGGEGCTFAPAGTNHAGFVDKDLHYLWWEPTTGAEPNLEPKWENGQLVNAHYTAVTLDKNGKPTSYSENFTVETRELKAGLKGSDVQMLEAVLWQLGISPERAKRGYLGRRLDEDERSNFSADATKSLSIMLKRFKGRSFALTVHHPATPTEEAYSTIDVAGIQQTAVVDTATLDQLTRVWIHYYAGYSDYKDDPVTSGSVPESWWTDLATLLNDGGPIPFEKAATSYSLIGLNVPIGSITAEFPTDAAGIKLEGVLQAWSQQETGGLIRGGTGKPVTPYRMHEGGADDHGSMGFNHILWKTMYGREPGCNALRGYLGNEHNVNLYSIRNSFLGFLTAAAHQGCSASNGLYRAYSAAATYATPIDSADIPFKYCYEQIGSASRCSAESNRTQWKTFTSTNDDGLNLLGKAIMAYNRGTSGLNERSYFSNTNTGLKMAKNPNSQGTKFDYWMDIKEITKTDPMRYGGYIPYVSYIWKGGVYTAPDPKAGQPWCFVYGEIEWVDGRSYNNIKNAAKNVDPDGAPQTPIGRISCE